MLESLCDFKSCLVLKKITGVFSAGFQSFHSFLKHTANTLFL